MIIVVEQGIHLIKKVFSLFFSPQFLGDGEPVGDGEGGGQRVRYLPPHQELRLCQ